MGPLINFYTLAHLFSFMYASHFDADVLDLLSQVVNRFHREETGFHDILCIDCHENWAEKLLVEFQKRHPYMPTMNMESRYGGSAMLENVKLQEQLYRSSVVLLPCVFDGKCTKRQLLIGQRINKYAIHFQFFENSSIAALDSALSSAKVVAIAKVVQVFGGDSRARIRCGGVFVYRYLEPPLSEVPDVLFNGALTRLDYYMYRVSVTPISSSLFVVNRTIAGFEVDIFRLIVERQRARFRFYFSRASDSSKLFQLLNDGEIDVILNIIHSKGRLNIVWAVWQEHHAYCITLPRTFERMHLDLLLHPFEWHIWLVLLGVLLFMQVLNVVFPTKFKYNIIMMCFFGSGPAEHVLPSSARMLVCSVCVIIFLITETYQAILLSLITAEQFMKTPETVDEFLDSNMTLYTIEGMKHMVPDNLLPVTDIVSSRMTLYSTFAHATIQQCSYASFWNTNPLQVGLPERNELVNIMPPIFYAPNYVIFSESSPAYREYQLYMDRLFEVGIYHYINHKWHPKRMLLEKESTFNDSIVLPEDLYPVWELLGVGLMISAIVFVGEWINFYLKIRRKFQSRSNIH